MHACLWGTHCATARALVAVVGAACEAGLAEAVAAGRGDRLVQQLQAEDALHIVQLPGHRPRPGIAGTGFRFPKAAISWISGPHPDP